MIRLSIFDSNGQPFAFDAIVDTGFNGSLTLPTSVILNLGLVWQTRGSAILANGAEEECDIYTGAVLWDEQPHSLLVEAADTDPLVGMRLMAGYRITVEDVDGGAVIIERM